MYEHIKGTLFSKNCDEAVIDIQGIGYVIRIPSSTFVKLPEIKETCFLYLTLVVREDAHTLYGFFTKQERFLFLLLRGVSGIGPKTALGLVGHLDLPLFQTAVAEQKASVLAKVPGIGTKTANRIILEMHDKLHLLERVRNEASLGKIDSLSVDAIAALINLGYPQNMAKKAVEKVRHEHESLSTLIPSALQAL